LPVLIGKIVSITYSFYNVLWNRELALLANCIVSGIGGGVFSLSAYTLAEQLLADTEFAILIAFSIPGLLLICSGTDFLTVYLALELSGLHSYTLSCI
jgi:NADH:ubiquinone oxidoreductase subunit 2 (subunit N)